MTKNEFVKSIVEMLEDETSLEELQSIYVFCLHYLYPKRTKKGSKKNGK